MDKKVLLELSNGLKIELPVLSGTTGPDVLNIKDLYKMTGLFTYDRSRVCFYSFMLFYNYIH